MRKLSTVRFTRGNASCVLQGMIHIGPTALYETLQAELDLAAQEGSTIFFEGIADYPELQQGHGPEEEKIRDSFKTIFSLFPLWASVFGFEQQKGKIRYPNNAVRADVKFSSIVKKLYQKRFYRSFLCRALTSAMIKTMINSGRMRRDLEIASAKDPDLFWREPGWKARLFKRLYMRKLIAVILHWRDQIAVGIIEQHLQTHDTQKAFIHYGEGHVRGMTKLLKKNGWRVSERTTRDIRQFIT